MNRCFVIGYLVSEVEFSFTLKKNPISIAKFDLKLLNNSIITVYSFNEVADFCYRVLKTRDCAFVEGEINTECNLISDQIYKIF